MLKANSDVKAGTVLMEAEPFVYVLQSKYQSIRCDHCLRKEEELHKCSGCQFVFYCNKQCQTKSWKMHKYECKNMKRCRPLILPDTARLMARIMIKFHIGEGSEKGYYMADKYRVFDDLMSHATEIKSNPEKKSHLFLLEQILKDFFKKDIQVPQSAELLIMYGRIMTNSFNISDNLENIGVAIYLGPSILDHSCSPNAIVTFLGTKIYVRCIKDIPKYNVSKIRISYIDLLQTSKMRGKELKDTYNFECTCPKCFRKDVKALAMCCPNVTCDYYCHASDITCKKCGHPLNDELINKFQKVIQFTISVMRTATEKTDLGAIEECLEMQKGIVHKLNVTRIKALETASQIARNLSLWEKAVSFSEQLIPGYLEYYTKEHHVTVDLYLTLAKMQLYLERLSDALKTCEYIEPTVTLIYGTEHPHTKLVQSMIFECKSDLKLC